MSIEHIVKAAEEHPELHSTAKLVLVSICDDASRETRIAWPGAEKMIRWSGASERRVMSIVEELIVRQLLARRRFGGGGLRGEYIVFPTPAEFEDLDRRDPRLNQVSQEAIDRVRASDERHAEEARKAAEAESRRAAARAARATKRAPLTSDEPVDNSEMRVPPVAPSTSVQGATQGEQGATGGTPPLSNSPTTHQSHTNVTTVGPVENRTEDRAARPTPRSIAGRHELDVQAIERAHGQLLAETLIGDDGVRQLAAEIIACSTSPVIDPTGYVIRALERDGIEWQRRAFQIATGTSASPLGFLVGRDF